MRGVQGARNRGVVVSMYMEAPLPSAAFDRRTVPLAGGIVLAVLVVLLIWFGVYPAPLVDAIGAVVVNSAM